MKAQTFAALGLAALAAGCADNNTSVQWYAICYPPGDAACPFSATCDTEAVGVIAYDPAVAGGTGGVILFAEMHNQRPDNADATIGRLNTNDAYVQQLTVTYTAPIALPTATVPVQATIPSAGSKVVPIVAVSGATTVAALGSLSGQTVVAHVVARGKYADESTFETAAFDIPIAICSGCTKQTCPDGSAPTGYCPNSTGAGQLPAGPVCVTATTTP